MAREFSRNQRLGNQILRTLSELIRFDSKDPRLDGIALTAVELSRDLSVADVRYSMLDPGADAGAADAAREGLESAAGFLRGKLGRAIKVRHVPQLRFVHDTSAAESDRISRLLAGALPDGD